MISQNKHLTTYLQENYKGLGIVVKAVLGLGAKNRL